MGFARAVPVLFNAFFCSRSCLAAENLALRQQLIVLRVRARGRGCVSVIVFSGPGYHDCGVAGSRPSYLSARDCYPMPSPRLSPVLEMEVA